jgi:hypothetical protein
MRVALATQDGERDGSDHIGVFDFESYGLALSVRELTRKSASGLIFPGLISSRLIGQSAGVFSVSLLGFEGKWHSHFSWWWWGGVV